MSLLDALKSAVLVDDPDISAPEPAATASVPEVAPPSTPIPSSDPTAANSFITKLRAKLQEPGSAIEKFESALSSLSMVPDEGMRFTAALSVLKGFGIDVRQLRLSYASKLGALDQEVVAVADTIWMLGRVKDRPGNQIVAVYDMIARGLAFHPGVQRMPLFAETVAEIQEEFSRL